MSNKEAVVEQSDRMPEWVVAGEEKSLAEIWLKEGALKAGVGVELVDARSLAEKLFELGLKRLGAGDEVVLGGEGKGQVRVVSDRWKRTWRGDKPRAYDSGDVVERYRALSGELSGEELKRLARKDEVGMLVASLAETVEMQMYPYRLFEFEDRVGSLTEIEGDNEEMIWVFRDIVDMLESRVAKFPDDDRSKAVLSGFEGSVVPGLLDLGEEETLVYFSPRAEEGKLEGEYGFVYFLTKRRDEQTGLFYFDAFSVKVDWEKEDYFGVFKTNGVVVNREKYDDDYQAITDQVVVSEATVGRVVEEVLGDDERLKGGAAEWLETQKSAYQEVVEFAGEREEGFVEGVVGGVIHNLRKLVEKIQLEWLKKKARKVYDQVVYQLRRFGFVQFLRACGFLEFGSKGFAGSLQGIMRGEGLGDGFWCPAPDCGRWIPHGSGDTCPNCHRTKYEIAAITGEDVC